MGKGVVIFLMLLAHIIDDFVLQTKILSTLKQRDFWKQNHPENLYRYDYVCALLVHALSWSIFIVLPIFYATSWDPDWWIYLAIVANMSIHAIVDDLKANKLKINLIADQSIHFVQILIVWLLWVVL